MVVKSLKSVNHVERLEAAFKIVERHRMRLNPFKCVFVVASRKFMVNQ